MVDHTFVIKPVGNHEVDVFLNEGWENWSRFKIFWKNKQPKLVLVKGQILSPDIYQRLIEEVNNVNNV